MKTVWKKTLAVLLAVILTAGIAPAVNRLAVIAAAQDISGTCGADGGSLSWSLDTETGVLTVSGTGDMADYDDEDNLAPWASYADTISSAVISSGVTSIGDCAFNGCMALTQVTIGTDVTRIGNDAFVLTGLSEVFVPASVREIGTTAFVGLTVSEDDDIVPTLERIDVDPANAVYSSADGVLYDKAQTVLIQYPCGKPAAAFTVPNGVKQIGSQAFPYCMNLENLLLSDGLETIGSMAFMYCFSLADITIPGSVKTIGEDVFEGCFSLQSVTFKDGVAEIPEGLFTDCESLKTVMIADSVTTIGNNAFAGCGSLENLMLGNGVKSIGESAFYHCDSLTNLTIPASVTEIGSYAFSDCSSLSSLTFNAVNCSEMNNVFLGDGIRTLVIGSGVAQIPAGAFAGLESVTTVTIPNSVTQIGAQAFQICRSLADVTIGSGVKTIGANAFQGCEALTNLHIPSGVTAIGADVFEYCANLAYICSDTETGAAKAYADSIGVEFRLCDGHGGSEPTDTVSGKCGAEGDDVTWTLDLNTGVLTIGGAGDMADFASYNNTPWAEYYPAIRTITIEADVTSIGDHAFQYCEMSGVTIPDSVTRIGETAFGYCHNLIHVTIPGSVTEMGDGAFGDCMNLASVTIENGVPHIGDAAFDGCRNLTNVTIPNSVTGIGSRAFSGCRSLQEITIPSSVSSIGSYAFCGCSELETVKIPASVTSVGERAFFACNKLQGITVDAFNTVYCSDDSGTLYDKEKTELIQYPAGSSASDFTVPASVTVIGDGAFMGCTALQNVTLPDALREIAAYAFEGCTEILYMHIPTSVSLIGEYAFSVLVTQEFEGSLIERYDPLSLYICSDTANNYAAAYAAENNIEFRLCVGHDNNALTISGTCGAEGGSVLWALNLGSGRMIISGTGDMADYADSADAPWADYLSSIQTVTIGSGVTSVGENAFNGCVPLSDAVIGDDVTRIGAGAFASSALTSVTVPACVTQIGADAFACGVPAEDGFRPTLRQIDVDADNAVFSSLDGVLFDKDQTVLILYPPANQNGIYEIPDTVTTVADGAFKGNGALMHVHVPYTVTQIGDDAFADCGALEYLCCDITDSCAETYAAEHNIPFLYCDGTAGQTGIPGDANGDGSVDLKDAILIRRYLADWDNIRIRFRCADVDADDAITLQDVVRITRCLAGGWDVVLL